MSKAKKFISMLLAVVMVISAAPVSLFASAADDTFTAGAISFSKPEFTVDTSATTEVIRVAAKADSFATGNLIVPATDSGIPKADSGYYIDVAYAGEPIITPQVVFSLTGATVSDVQVTPSVSTITLNLVNNPEQVNGTTTYIYEIASGSTATKGTDVVYTITYKVGGQTYTSYAFSHVENILVQTGYVVYKRDVYQAAIWGANPTNNDQYFAAIVQLASKNMYSGMANNTPINTRGYINYAAQGNSSNGYLVEHGEASNADYYTLSGTGLYDNFGSDEYSYAKAANASAGEVGVLIKGHSALKGSAAREDRYNLCIENDGNRGEATVYIDKRNEIFGADANGKDGLNMRLSMQVAESHRFDYAYVSAIGLYDGRKTLGQTENIHSNSITAPLSVTANNTQVRVTQKNGANYYNWSYSYFSGDPMNMATSTAAEPWKQYSMFVDIHARREAASMDNESTSAGGINLNIGVYDTRDLYNLYNGILNGQSMTCVTDAYKDAGLGTINFTNGVNPQSFMY